MGNIQSICMDKSNHKNKQQRRRKVSQDSNHYSDIGFVGITQNDKLDKQQIQTTRTHSKQTKQQQTNKQEFKNNKTQQQEAILSFIQIPQPQNHEKNTNKVKQIEKSQDNSDNYNHQEQQIKSSRTNSIDDLNIPNSSIISKRNSSQQLLSQKQIQLILFSNHLSIQQYKNFCSQTKTDKQNNLINTNPFTSFCQLIFELLSTNDSKIQLIKNKIIHIQQFVQNTYIDQQNDYGEISDPMHMKKIFLQYLIRLLTNESSITLIENYSILIFLLEPIVISIVLQINQQIKDTIKSKYSQRIFDDQFFTIIAQCLKLQFKKQNNRMLFQEQNGKQLVIQQIEGSKCKSKLLK